MKEVRKGDVLTRGEMKAYGLEQLDSSFSNLLIYKKGNERFLAKDIGHGKYEIYLTYTISPSGKANSCSTSERD